MKILHPATLLVLMLFFSGCTTTSPKNQPMSAATDPAPVPAQRVTLQRGASGQTVRDALGKPDKIEPVKENPAAALWIYRRAIAQRVNVVEATMQDTLVFDATNLRTGMATVQVPVQQMQKTVVEELLVLIMVNDQLTDWRRSQREITADQIIR